MSRLSLPAVVLHQVRCLRCQNFISVFPVYVKSDQTNGICGRCKPEDSDQYCRDEAYELLAQFVLFPCIHQEEGCPAYLVPSLLKEHEPRCEFRKYRCAAAKYTRCDWKGPLTNMFSHFKQEHPKLVINEQQFKLDFNTSTEEKLLMKFDEELFVIEKEIDARNKSFTCTVDYLKGKAKDRCYYYNLRIESNSMNYFHRTERRMANGQDPTNLEANFLWEKLQDTYRLIVRIDVYKTAFVTDEIGNEATEEAPKNPTVSWEIIHELECPICYDYMVPPIYQCCTGHSICKKCKPVINNCCPLCKETVGTTKNFTLEKLTHLIIYPCTYHARGCNFTCTAADIETHEASCDLGHIQCPLMDENDCDWCGFATELVEHVEVTHNNKILKTDQVSVDFNETICTTNLIIFNEKVFKLTYNHDGHFCTWGMQVAGRFKENEYNFEINVIDDTGAQKRFLVSGTVISIKTPLLNTSCAVVADVTLDAYTTDKLVYLIRVVKQ